MTWFDKRLELSHQGGVLSYDELLYHIPFGLD